MSGAGAAVFFFELVLMLVAPVAVGIWLDAYIRRRSRRGPDDDSED